MVERGQERGRAAGGGDPPLNHAAGSRARGLYGRLTGKENLEFSDLRFKI